MGQVQRSRRSSHPKLRACSDHPIAWSHAVGAGRSFYTNLGHRSQTYGDPRFRAHVRDGVLWAARRLLFDDGFERGDLAGWSAAP